MKKGLIWIVGFWTGIIIISLLNIALILFKKDQMTYNLYISGVAIFILVLFLAVRSRRKKNQNHQIHKK